MFQNGLIGAIIGVITAAGGYWLVRRIIAVRREAKLESARKQFTIRREWLEADFLQTASSTGKPRGLTWIDCEFSSEVSFARDRKSGELTALVGVAIQFEAIEGGCMEDVEAVANRKAATAVFRHDGSGWSTDGRAIFNLNPVEAIEYYRSELEVVE